jgi:hypothetical protein
MSTSNQKYISFYEEDYLKFNSHRDSIDTMDKKYPIEDSVKNFKEFLIKIQIQIEGKVSFLELYIIYKYEFTAFLTVENKTFHVHVLPIMMICNNIFNPQINRSIISQLLLQIKSGNINDIRFVRSYIMVTIEHTCERELSILLMEQDLIDFNINSTINESLLMYQQKQQKQQNIKNNIIILVLLDIYIHTVKLSNYNKTETFKKDFNKFILEFKENRKYISLTTNKFPNNDINFVYSRNRDNYQTYNSMFVKINQNEIYKQFFLAFKRKHTIQSS